MTLPLQVPFPQWLRSGKLKVLTSLSHLKGLWTIWNLRSFILVSLGFQILLIVVAPFRKKTANSVVIATVWLGYLLADYVAAQAVGLIPKYSTRVAATDAAYATHGDLLAFWAPFLLVHLGGPDPITALALEDNELWTRTMLHLVTYSSATGRVFFQSLPTNILSIPTLLMFAAGICKYLERILSLYNARLTQFKSSMLTDPDPGPNYAKLMESFDSYLNSDLPAKFDTNPEPDQYNVFTALSVDQSKFNDSEDEEEHEQIGSQLAAQGSNTTSVRSKLAEMKRLREERLANVKLVRDAFEFFDKYKGLYVDLIFTFHDRNKSRSYFIDPKLKPEAAFTVLEIELNFTYEVFFTKMIVIHKTSGTSLRWASFVCEVVSLLIWVLFIDKNPFQRIDIMITYVLLVGAIAIDIVAFFMFIFSDWKLAMLSKESETRALIYNKLLSARYRSWGKCWKSKEADWGPWLRRIFFRRWSESISKFNLIDYCVNRPSGCFAKLLFKLPVIKDKCLGLKYVSRIWFANGLRDFIFRELRYKAEIAEDPKDAEEMCQSKGDWVLRSLSGLGIDPHDFYPWTKEIEYDECLLLWHIATELLYQVLEEEEEDDNNQMEKNYRRYCKTLSDYMLYLLNRQPVMMFAVAGISDVRFRDTCAEATIFFDRVLRKAKPMETMKDRHKEACKRMMAVNTKKSPRDIKGDRSKSVLFDAVGLAKKLKEKLKDDAGTTVGMWELMAKVWVELLCYSATHCRASAHAAQLKQGGELLTIVWLMMVHLGLGNQFRITQGNARSKLILSE